MLDRLLHLEKRQITKKNAVNGARRDMALYKHVGFGFNRRKVRLRHSISVDVSSSLSYSLENLLSSRLLTGWRASRK